MLNRVLAVLTGSCVLLLVGCQHQANQPNLPGQAVQRIDDASIRLQTDKAFDRLVSLRRDLHTHPELAGNEVRTAAAIATRLRELGLEVQTGL